MPCPAAGAFLSSVSHICDKRRPGLPAAAVGAVSAGASQAAPGSPEKSLAAGICPRGQSCRAPCSAAAGVAGAGGDAQPAAHPTGQGTPQWHTGHRHTLLAFTGREGKLFHKCFHRGVNRMSCCGQCLPVLWQPGTTVQGVWQCRCLCHTCSSQGHL